MSCRNTCCCSAAAHSRPCRALRHAAACITHCKLLFLYSQLLASLMLPRASAAAAHGLSNNLSSSCEILLAGPSAAQLTSRELKPLRVPTYHHLVPQLTPRCAFLITCAFYILFQARRAPSMCPALCQRHLLLHPSVQSREECRRGTAPLQTTTRRTRSGTGSCKSNTYVT